MARRADITGIEDVPAPPAAKFSNTPEGDVNQPDKVKEAQAIAGELQWLCGRRRPELTYGVNLMAQAITTAPDEALERGYQLIRFLRKHPTGGLVFPKGIPVLLELAQPGPRQPWRALQMRVSPQMDLAPSRQCRFTSTEP